MKKLLLILTITTVSSVQSIEHAEAATLLSLAGRTTDPMLKRQPGESSLQRQLRVAKRKAETKKYLLDEQNFDIQFYKDATAQQEAIDLAAKHKIAQDALAKIEQDKYLLAEQNIEHQFGKDLAHEQARLNAEEAARYQVYLELNQPGRFGQMLESLKDQWNRVPSNEGLKQFDTTQVGHIPSSTDPSDYADQLKHVLNSTDLSDYTDDQQETDDKSESTKAQWKRIPTPEEALKFFKAHTGKIKAGIDYGKHAVDLAQRSFLAVQPFLPPELQLDRFANREEIPNELP